jgi:hypothetical protein
MDKEEKSKETFGGLATVIPQVFYDVIARIIPGGLILIILYVINKGGIDKTIISAKSYFSGNDQIPSFLFFCFWVLLSYCVAIILWRQIDWYYYFFEKKMFKKKGISADKYVSYLYDYIKTKDSSAGARITKLSAEIHMTEVLSVGIFYGLLYNTIIIICQINAAFCSFSFNFWNEIFLVLFLIGSYSLRKFFQTRITRALHNYFIIYDNPNLTQIHHNIETLEDGLKALEDEK